MESRDSWDEVVLVSSYLIFILRYFKSNFKLIKKVWKTNVNIFVLALIFYPFLNDFMKRIELGDFYAVRRILSSVETFLQCVDFYLNSEETFLQCVDIYPMRRLLSSIETFLQCVGFYTVWRLLSKAETFIHCRLFCLTKQRKTRHTETTSEVFKNYSCN